MFFLLIAGLVCQGCFVGVPRGGYMWFGLLLECYGGFLVGFSIFFVRFFWEG